MKRELQLINDGVLKWLSLIFTVLIISGTSEIASAQFTPFHYFTFDGSNPLKDSLSTTQLNPLYYQSTYSISNGTVGKALSLGVGGKDIIVSNGIGLDTAISVEFLFKPSHDFGITTFLSRRDGAIYIKMDYPYILFITNSVSSSGATIHDEQKIELEGIGRASYSYYVDGDFHQMAFKYNARTGVKQVWIDGELPPGFSTTTATGRFNSNSSNPNNNIIDLSSVTSYDRLNGEIDEMALYNLDLPGNMIYKHYTEFKGGKHYSFNSTTLTVPVPSPVTAGVDLNDYPAGHPTPSVNAVDQIKSFPTPRYKKGHTLLPNFDWIGMEYFGSAYQPGVSTSQAIANSVSIQSELARNFNYSILVASNTCTYNQYGSTGNFQGAWLQLANQNPQWKTGAICFWAQINPQIAGYSSNVGYISNKNLPIQHYIKNSSNQFLDLNGNVTTNKYWSPSTPVDSFYKDGLTQKFLLTKLLAGLTRPLDFLCENGEVIPKLETSSMQKDPSVVADKNSTSYDWDTYLGSRKLKSSLAYRDQFISLPGLQNTHYTEYQISGSTFRIKYSQTRNINKPINGQVYATPDFYPRWSSNWFTGAGAWNGWKHIIEGRYYELQHNDKLYSPFVAAGWDLNEEKNIRPGQWLGLLKVLGMTGAEFYYTGYFNEQGSYNAPNPPPADPSGYAWQAVIPSYAQATTSRYEDLLRNGSLLPGDVPYSTGTPNQPGYSFNTGDVRKLVVVRKSDTKDVYAITGTIQPNSNMIGNAEIDGDAMITLNGKQLQFGVRRQGSTYIYDNSNPAQPVFYQIDSWHESSHPSRWSKDFNFEAEVFDNNITAAQIKTDRTSSAGSADFRNSTSYVTRSSTASSNPTLEYNFTPRITTNYYFWIRARNHGGAPAGISVSLNNQPQKSISCISDTAWNWYSLDACSNTAISFQNTTAQENVLMITPNGASIEIDRMMLTIDPSLNLNSNQAVCGTSVASVNLSGPSTFCQGGNVTLTATAGTAYRWSGGQTTQSITVSNSGSYSVNVSNGSGCASISNPVIVTVQTNPSAVISAAGPTTVCTGQSVALTASSASSYLWSNGATTQTINANNSGSYIVTVTNSSGCSATSNAQTINVTSAPNAAITANGSTTFCQGSNVILSAPAGYSYNWSTGQTTQQITVSNAGSYMVTVSNSSSCTSTSAASVISVRALPSAIITANGPLTFCNGGNVILSASGGTNYLWSDGSSSQTITATQTSSYNVTVTDANGCSATSNNVSVQNTALPGNTISVNGPLLLTPGLSTTLTAPTGSSYLWQPGGMTAASITVFAAGTYSVTVTNANNCSVTSSSVVITQSSVTANLKIQPSGSTSFCDGGNVTLVATGGTNNYLWSPGGSSSTSISATKEGTYYVYSLDNNGMVVGRDSIHISVNPVPLTPEIRITYIPNTAYQLTAFEPSAVKYLWSNGAITASVNVIQPQSLTVKTTNAFGCSSNIQQMTVNSLTSKSCVQPDMLTAFNLNDTSATLGWNPSVSGEIFKIRYWENGSSNFTEFHVGGTVSTASLPNLLPGTKYNWYVSTVCVSGTYQSSVSSFTTLSNPLSCGSVPEHLRAVNIKTTLADLVWYSTTADNYKVQYRPVGSVTWTSFSLAGAAYSRGTSLINLIPNTTYEWNVSTTCKGYTTPFSLTSMFTTLDACGDLGILSLVTSNISSAQIKWTNINSMNSVRVKITDISTGLYRVIALGSNQTNGTYTVKNLSPNKTYTAEVRGICTSGIYGPWTNEITFNTKRIIANINSGSPLMLNGYPNPATDRLFYSFVSDKKSDYIVKVADLEGKQLLQETRTADEGDNADQISVNNFSQGIYLLIVQKGTETSRFRFAIE